jgi:hypothetical protein
LYEKSYKTGLSPKDVFCGSPLLGMTRIQKKLHFTFSFKNLIQKLNKLLLHLAVKLYCSEIKTEPSQKTCENCHQHHSVSSKVFELPNKTKTTNSIITSHKVFCSFAIFGTNF